MKETRVALPEHFDFAWTIRFLSARTVPSIERIAVAEYRRSLRVGDGVVTLGIRLDAPAGGRPSLRIRSSPALPEAEARRLVRAIFDLDADLDAFRERVRVDPLLGPLVARQPHIRLPQLLDPFEGLLRAILGQQVSVAAASTLADRLVRLAGEPAPELDGEAFLCFPSARAVAALGTADLLGIGLTRARAASILAAAEAVGSGRVDLAALRSAPPGEVDGALTGLRGIGPWTASYVRMRALGDRDAFPASDLGIVKAMRALEGTGDPREILRRAERWRPWRAYAALHLWESLAPR